ncbi:MULTISPECIES: 16S rRNA (cytosine(1402)-N(4))-methyltransferase RsmH [unclassified Treponema]|uniref:16S rRNA (cytosine(1402)-N(4))-methyltransferase RsmH n=1 Tax=unclassified Treponema TaxID=2638727 RepID=UPI0020A59103|nr:MULTISPECIES: 16S rRNA (cytosine(1402)-N(4))-methyltransferase RsmH [unclassified Treponema]UTC65890.1 16S rRNA (cytosine(1402)-N(4))-methyltransferase RsmH [Treponema sp. OMZ 789]UTC68618.1 16S rRNA (cytosine(1402)-N(4))-methyltransferase RsmH [Treponema sp. OMZ 790]UTC71348.1 16S rRNA (cytosine(1402)-N(4))-methyltransferase RsmH [Treponema sp. OMZ 791]
MPPVHTSVLLEECLQFLKPDASHNLFVDGTLGEGGHTEAFLKKYPQLNAVGVDADASIQDFAKERLKSFGGRVRFHLGWSDAFFKNYPKELNSPDLILLDLGISMFHYVKSGRGFSFALTEPLDMRLNPDLKLSAADIVNSYKEKELADLIFNYGEERYSRKIASRIAEQRLVSAFTNAKELADCIYKVVPQNYRHGKIHPATKTFQALRIAVNGELDRLPRLLDAAFAVLAPNGKLGVITFHSLEDRIVKMYFKELGKNCTCPENMPICKCGGRPKAEVLTKKAVKASDEEIRLNPPSRSARLRVVRKIDYRENEK